MYHLTLFSLRVKKVAVLMSAPGPVLLPFSHPSTQTQTELNADSGFLENKFHQAINSQLLKG